jgi:4-hydroxy-tetrahydrodipicolinate synthase
VIVGAGGNDTRKAVAKARIAESYQVDGLLTVCPYYNRPNQNGLFEHFLTLAEATPLNMIIYNIPYRTGVNLENDTVRKLAEQSNIIGIKDSCGQISQTLELLADKPPHFAVLTGEDMLFFTTLVNGGDGGILASAHLHTKDFIKVYHQITANDHQAARQRWQKLQAFIPLLFAEPNPAPLKYCLKQMGLIRSAAVRLPLTPASAQLIEKLDAVLSLQ